MDHLSIDILHHHHHHLFAPNDYWQQLTTEWCSRAGQKGTKCSDNCHKRHIQ